MSILYRIYSSTADTGGQTFGSTYATVRTNTAAAGNVTNTTQEVGQKLVTTTYTVGQAFPVFDTSSVPAGSTTALDLTVTVAPGALGDVLEVREVSSISNKISGDSLASWPLVGSWTMAAGTGHRQFTMTADVTRSATLYLVVAGQKQRLNTAPTAIETVTINLADVTGTTSDPFLDLIGGQRWDHVSLGTSVEATGTSHVLTEPAGVAAGDLLVACISSRIASATQITLPAGWTRVGQTLNNNILSTTSALSSACMAYIVRGASAPSYTFTHPVAPSVALGRVIAYRGVNQSSPLDTQSATTAPTNTLSGAVGGFTTAQDDELIVAMFAGGQEASVTFFACNIDPILDSGTGSSSLLDPIWGQWLERADVQTTTGVDTSLSIFDAVKQFAGATGTFQFNASLGAGHSVIGAAFKLTPSGTTYNDTIAETAAAAETVALQVQSYRRELENGVDWRETEAGLIRRTEGDFFVHDESVAESAAALDVTDATITSTYNKAVAETAAAAETVAGLLTVMGALAETAAAGETISGLLNTTKAVAETTAAVDTIIGLLTISAAIAESAAALDAPDATVTAGGTIYNKDQTETAGAAETVAGLLTVTGAVAETAAAVETIGGLRAFTGAVAETVAAADTVGGLLAASAAIAETVAAAETLTSSLTYTSTVAETAVAAESVGGQIIVTGAVAETAAAVETTSGLLVTTKAVVETAAAADTVVGLSVRIGAIAETALAAETITGLLSTTSAIIETASAAETIGASIDAAGGIFNVSVDETVTAAETISGRAIFTVTVAETAVLVIRELENGVDWRETEDGVARDIAGGAVAETLTSGIAYAVTVAETAAAAETINKTLVRAGAVAETAIAAETITGLLSTASAIVETAAAVETISKTLTYTGTIAETAAAAETISGPLVRAGVITETAAAAETITTLLSGASAIVETASAAETIGASVVSAGGVINVSVAESASAVETIAKTVSFTKAIAETASAAETMTSSVTPSTTGYVKVWTGSAWELKPVKVWTGSSWVKKLAKRWNGSAWVS